MATMANTDIPPAFGADIRKEFMLRENCVYLNHGSYGGIPRCVHEKQVRYLEELESHPDSWFRYKSFQYVRSSKERVAEFMGIQADDTFFIQNVTKAINTVMKTFPLKPGDAFLMNSLTYGAVKLTARSTVNRVEGAKLYQVDLDFPDTDENSVVEKYEEFLATHPDVKLAALDHITSPTSVVLPIKRIIEVCHKYGVVVVVDAAHVPGQLQVDIQDIDADFYSGTMHKWAFSPRACAFIWMNPKRHHAWFRPLITSKFENEALQDAFSFEGTNDDTPFICSADGIEYMNRIDGMNKVVQYNSMLVSKGVEYLVEKWGTKRLSIPKHMEAPCLRIVYLPYIHGFSDRLIDADAILSMNDQQLKNYIVAYGDRVATVAFCKGLKNTDHRTEKTLDRIRQKNLLSKKCSKLQGNKHAKKTQRRVELGLKQYDFFTKTYKQVRSQCGGGIRNLSVTVDSKLLEILQYGKDLFFPDGHNCFGSLDEFEVSLYDFQGHPANLDQTLAECYDEFKLKLLRVYVYTKKKCPVTDGESTCAVEQTPQDDCPSVDSLEKQVTPEHTHVPPQESLSLGEASPGSCCVKKAEEHMIEAGTPTVLIKQSVLQGPSSSQDDSVSDVEILDLPVIHFRKRRSLNLKNNSPDRKRQSESEDSDSMAAAVRASLDDNGKSLQEILIELSSQIDQHGDANLVNVDRNNILDGGRRGFTRKKFRAECKLSIKFSGEYGIDEGGPSREFMRLALKAIHESPIFEGEENAKIICPDLPSADRNDYYIFGKMIAYFIVHKGPSPCFFSSTMYQLLAGKPCYPNIADVGDFEIRTQLQMIKETEDLRKLSLPESIMQAVEYVGAVPLLSLNKKDKILDALLDYFVLNRVKGVLPQFLDGLSSLGILKAIREFPVTMRPLFIYQKAAAATTAYIEELFVPVFSTEGSNKYVEELRTQSHWRDFLEDLAEQPDGLESLLRFVTGLDAAPALGFEPHPSLKFNHPDTENPFDGTPYANTCTNTLSLPVVHNYETFCERMNMALSLGTFFSNA